MKLTYVCEGVLGRLIPFENFGHVVSSFIVNFLALEKLIILKVGVILLYFFVSQHRDFAVELQTLAERFLQSSQALLRYYGSHFCMSQFLEIRQRTKHRTNKLSLIRESLVNGRYNDRMILKLNSG